MEKKNDIKSRILHASSIAVLTGAGISADSGVSTASAAKDSGAYVVEINLEETPNAYFADEVLTGRASEIVPGLI